MPNCAFPLLSTTDLYIALSWHFPSTPFLCRCFASHLHSLPSRFISRRSDSAASLRCRRDGRRMDPGGTADLFSRTTHEPLRPVCWARSAGRTRTGNTPALTERTSIYAICRYHAGRLRRSLAFAIVEARDLHPLTPSASRSFPFAIQLMCAVQHLSFILLQLVSVHLQRVIEEFHAFHPLRLIQIWIFHKAV